MNQSLRCTTFPKRTWNCDQACEIRTAKDPRYRLGLVVETCMAWQHKYPNNILGITRDSLWEMPRSFKSIPTLIWNERKVWKKLSKISEHSWSTLYTAIFRNRNIFRIILKRDRSWLWFFCLSNDVTRSWINLLNKLFKRIEHGASLS